MLDARNAYEARLDDGIEKVTSQIRKNVAGDEAKLTAQVNEAIQKNREPLDDLEAKMEEASKEARDKYDAPWYKKLGRWLLSALGAILKALAFLVVAVGLVVIGIVRIIVGVLGGSIAALISGIILVVGVIAVVLYGVAKGIVNRVKSAHGALQTTLAVIIGIPILRVSPVLSRESCTGI